MHLNIRNVRHILLLHLPKLWHLFFHLVRIKIWIRILLPDLRVFSFVKVGVLPMVLFSFYILRFTDYIRDRRALLKSTLTARFLFLVVFKRYRHVLILLYHFLRVWFLTSAFATQGWIGTHMQITLLNTRRLGLQNHIISEIHLLIFMSFSIIVRKHVLRTIHIIVLFNWQTSDDVHTCAVLNFILNVKMIAFLLLLVLQTCAAEMSLYCVMLLLVVISILKHLFVAFFRISEALLHSHRRYFTQTQIWRWFRVSFTFWNITDQSIISRFICLILFFSKTQFFLSLFVAERTLDIGYIQNWGDRHLYVIFRVRKLVHFFFWFDQLGVRKNRLFLHG